MTSLSEPAVIFLVSAGMCLLVGRLAIRALANAQFVAPVRYQDCPPLQTYQEAKSRTPTMGGVFVLVIAILIAVASGGLDHREGWLVLGAVTGLAVVGLYDDCLKFRAPNALGIRTMPKLLAALAIGAGLGLASVTGSNRSALEMPWLHRTIELGWMWVPFSALVVAGCAHAVNLTDGMDGLAAGCVAIALGVLGVLAWESGDPRSRALVPWCASLAGGCIGFLWFNTFPASVFLGDVGALGLGAALGVISLLSRTALLLPVIGGVFVVEALSVMLQVASYKWRGKQRIFRVAPIHHHFHLGGTSEPKLIVRFWIVGVILAMVGLTTLVMP